MPIRPQAAREVARSIVEVFDKHPTVTVIDLVASLISGAVERDELRVRNHDVELRLIAADAPDSLGG